MAQETKCHNKYFTPGMLMISTLHQHLKQTMFCQTLQPHCSYGCLQGAGYKDKITSLQTR